MKRQSPDSKPHGALTIRQSKNGLKAYFCGVITGDQRIRLLQELATDSRWETAMCSQILATALDYHAASKAAAAKPVVKPVVPAAEPVPVVTTISKKVIKWFN
jgi:hypothetical protein